MKSTKFFPPYFKKGRLSKCTLKTSFQKVSGVYIIKSLGVDSKVLYVGYSTNNLYRTMYRHFQSHKDEQTRHVYGKFSVKVRIIKTTESQAFRLEKYLIKKMKPTDNENTYENETIKPIDLTTVNYFTSGDTFVEEYDY
jgi:excinuclease UvrABC nuclease subunit